MGTAFNLLQTGASAGNQTWATHMASKHSTTGTTFNPLQGHLLPQTLTTRPLWQQYKLWNLGKHFLKNVKTLKLPLFRK